jgi:hypothetical protein
MNDDMEMPRYQCIKCVHALEINTVERLRRKGDGTTDEVEPGVRLSFADEGYAPLDVDWKVVSRYMPVQGDYFVVYDDGYQSISPRKTFKEGYIPFSRPNVKDPVALSRWTLKNCTWDGASQG